MSFKTLSILFAKTEKNKEFFPVYLPESHHTELKTFDVILPTYMEKEYYIDYHEHIAKLKYYGLKFEALKSMDELQMVSSISGFQLYMVCYYTNPKNKFVKAFDKSIKKQIKDWIKKGQQGDYPLTGKQEKALYSDDKLRARFLMANKRFQNSSIVIKDLSKYI